MNKLVVTYLPVANSSATDISAEWGPHSHDVGYRVALQTPKGPWAIPMLFERSIDAERAVVCIRDLIDWQGTPEQVTDRLRHYGFQRLRRRMTEHLAW